MTKSQIQDAIKKYGPVYVERGENEVLQFFEVDEVSDADAKQILAGIKKSLMSSFDKPPVQESAVVGDPSVKRPKQIKAGYSLYDMYKVQKEFQEVDGRMAFTGNVIKVGKPIKVNIKIPEYRANIFNEQSANTGEMLFPVHD